MRISERAALTSVLSLATLLLAAGGALAAAPAQAGSNGDWPKTIPLGERKVILAAPRTESLDGTALKARGTFGLVRKGETEPICRRPSRGDWRRSSARRSRVVRSSFA